MEGAMNEAGLHLRRVRAAYERGRMRAALVRGLPAIAVVVAAALLLGGEWVRVWSAAGVAAAAWFLLWRGQAFGAGVFPGVAAGIVPLVTSTVMAAGGHSCTMGGGCECSTACIVACSVAGSASGFLLAVVLRRQPTAALTGAVVAIGVGLIGCAPLGFSSAAGMALGALAAFAAVRAGNRLVARSGLSLG